MSDLAATQYPIVLSHGILARAVTFGIPFWWGIQKALEAQGARVFISDQPAFASQADNAVNLRDFVLQVLAETGAEKVNIIGHANGALEARYMVSKLGMGDKVASLTSVAAPHRGSALVDFVLHKTPRPLLNLIAAGLNLYGRLMGDERPDSLRAFSQLTRDYMQQTFNPQCPDDPKVYYQSWTGRIRYIDPEKAIFWGVPWLIMRYYEGANDGWVSTESAKWGNFLGEQRGAKWASGVSHDNEINHFFGLFLGYDARPYYVEVVGDLKKRGF